MPNGDGSREERFPAMKVRNADKEPEKIELQMTPMIDIVFQLLTFFIMTFKIVLPEGDFNIKMPLNAPSQGAVDPNLLPPMKVRLQAGANGDLAGISMNGQTMKNFDELNNFIIGLVGDQRGPSDAAEGAEVELECDYNLKYANVIKAITAVSGYIQPDGKVVKLVEKIKFAPPKKKDE
jgi:biopolymer transport protein ExbD